MTYLGTAKIENGVVRLPDGSSQAFSHASYEAVELNGNILLLANPLDRKRIEQIESLARHAITDHRKSLEGLAK